MQECYKSGMDFLLAKPIRRPALKNVLNRYCAPILEVEEETIADPKPTAAEVASTVQAMADPGTTTIIVSTAPITNTTNPPTPTPTPNAAEEAAGRADQHGDSMRKDLSPHS